MLGFSTWNDWWLHGPVTVPGVCITSHGLLSLIKLFTQTERAGMGVGYGMKLGPRRRLTDSVFMNRNPKYCSSIWRKKAFLGKGFGKWTGITGSPALKMDKGSFISLQLPWQGSKHLRNSSWQSSYDDTLHFLKVFFNDILSAEALDAEHWLAVWGFQSRHRSPQISPHFCQSLSLFQPVKHRCCVLVSSRINQT